MSLEKIAANKIDKAMAGFIEEKLENSPINQSVGTHAISFIQSFILHMFLSPVNRLSFRNTTKIKAYKSLALMGLSV